MTTSLAVTESIASKILFIRGERVLLDSDLSLLYGIETKVLKQAVRRNVDRFPKDFLFRLTADEWEFLRSQIVTLKKSRSQHIRYLPFAFTEQGVAMLSSVLRGKRAIVTNIAIMRAFAALRIGCSTAKASRQRFDTSRINTIRTLR